MAIVYSSVSNHWRSYLNYTVTETDTSVTIDATGGFGSYNWGFQLTGVDSTLSCTGMTSVKDTGSVSTATGATKNVRIASASWTIAKGTSAKTVTVSCKTVNDSGYMEATLTAKVTVSIPALSSYSITYNANGGTGAPANGTKHYGQSYVISTVKPTRANYNFLGWATSSTATTANGSYDPGDTYTANAALTLYAVWAVAYQPPTISNLSIGRCTSSGAADDYGSYALVKFNWSCDQSAGTNKATKYVITVNGSSSTTSLSATSGSASKVVGSGRLGTDSVYSVTIALTDSKSGTTTVAGVVPAVSFPLDFRYDGKGVAVGKPSSQNGFECAFEAFFAKDVTLDNNVHINGTTANGTVLECFNALNGSDILVIGAGGYANQTGETQVRGNKVAFKAASAPIATDKQFQVHSMTVQCSATLSMTTSFQKVTCGTLVGRSGTLLSQSSGGIKCATDGYVLASGVVYANDMTSGDRISARILQNSTTVNTAYLGSGGSFHSTYVSPVVLEVAAGDVIYLYAGNYNSSSGTVSANNARTFLTVTYVG